MDDFQAEHHRNGRIELAKDIVGGLISIRSARMGDEDKKDVLDQELVTRLINEQTFYRSVLWNLYSFNLDEIDSLIEKYNALLKEERAQRVACLAEQ